MRLIYLASPYTYKDKAIEAQRFRLACRACGKILNRGLAVYSPIVHWHCVHNLCQLKGGFETFKDVDTEMITRADELWILMIKGTYKSKGIQAEIAIARAQSKPIRCYRIEEDSVL
jgi:nucleoside 2-deoxyribosyltransferase